MGIWGKLKFLLDFFLKGGPLDGKKLIVGVLTYFVPMWLGIPMSPELQLLIQQTAEIFIMWGLVGKGYKMAKGEKIG